MNLNEDMNQNPETENGQEGQFPVREEKSMGAILGSVIVIIILLIAAFYLWGNRGETPEIAPQTGNDTTIIDETPGSAPKPEDTEKPEEEVDDAQAQILEDEELADEIMEDLETTELDDLTSEIDEIEGELGL